MAVLTRQPSTLRVRTRPVRDALSLCRAKADARDHPLDLHAAVPQHPAGFEMVMGFVLPFALAFVAIPFESFVHSLRTVIDASLVQGTRGLGVLLRFVGLLFKRSERVLELAYDLTIVVPLMIEQWVFALRAGPSTGPSVEADDTALTKSRRAA